MLWPAFPGGLDGGLGTRRTRVDGQHLHRRPRSRRPHERAVAAGAQVVRELDDMDYGSREYSARDLDGNLWSFGTYQPG